MGDISKILHLSELDKRSVTSLRYWADLSENAHLHLQNVRLEYSMPELKILYQFLAFIFPDIFHVADKVDYQEGNPDFLHMWTNKLIVNPDSDYYSNRLSIELQRDNTVHVHYRNLRLHLSAHEFEQIAKGFVEALKGYKEYTPVKLDNGEQMVDIDKIQPYDDGHKPGVIDDEHRQGIDYFKEQIAQGKEIQPILIRPDGVRVNGFKRYMAHKEMGLKQIKCIVKDGSQYGEEVQRMTGLLGS
jgi:hypothetical protein